MYETWKCHECRQSAGKSTWSITTMVSQWICGWGREFSCCDLSRSNGKARLAHHSWISCFATDFQQGSARAIKEILWMWIRQSKPSNKPKRCHVCVCCKKKGWPHDEDHSVLSKIHAADRKEMWFWKICQHRHDDGETSTRYSFRIAEDCWHGLYHEWWRTLSKTSTKID